MYLVRTVLKNNNHSINVNDIVDPFEEYLMTYVYCIIISGNTENT